MLKFRWETEFKETEIGEIPRDWGVRKLGNALRSLESGNRPRGGVLAHNPNGVLSIGGENINWDGSLELDDCLRFNESFYDSLRKGKIEVGDVLLVKDGATIGKLAYISRVPEERAMVNEHVFLLKTDPAKFDSRFLFYFLFSEVGQQQIEGSISGSAQGGINKTILDDILVFYPPLSQQSRIATVLSWFDDLIEVKKRQNEILEKTAMAIFKSWFIDFEPFRDGEFVYSEELEKEIPKGWEVKRIIDLSSIVSGRGKYLIEASEGIYPLWGANGVLGYIENYDLEGFSIITGRVGTLGNVFLVEGKFAISDNVLCIIPHQDFWVFFLFLWIKSQIDFESLNVGTSQPLITKTALGNQPIIFPPSHILQSFHSLIEPLFQKIILNQKQIMTLRKIRDTLLPLLVFGKLRLEEI
jgi:type I restriction enzyme S subunit